MHRVAVFGMGYVGCVTAACLSRDGHHVTGVDIEAAKVSEINAGIAPISEPGLDQLLVTQVKSGRLIATTDAETAVANSDMALIAVGTPSMDDGNVNYQGVKRVIESIGQALRGRSTPYHVVLRSTVLPGVLEDQLQPILERTCGRELGTDLVLCNNPEFLREGSAVDDYYQPPFVLVGASSEACATPVLDLYRAVDSEKIVTSTRTAAQVKYACNAFHALKVAFANEIGSLSRDLGADGHEVMSLVCRDKKLNVSAAYLRPGFAFGGSCLPKDVRALVRTAEQRALKTNLLASILPSNESHLKRALKLVKDCSHKKLGLVGLSFKSGTDDLRESPMVELVETLIGWGFEVKIYDPHVMLSRLRGRNLAYIDRHLPHLAQLLVPQLSMVLNHAELLILASNVVDDIEWRASFSGVILDLRKDLAVLKTAAS